MAKRTRHIEHREHENDDQEHGPEDARGHVRAGADTSTRSTWTTRTDDEDGGLERHRQRSRTLLVESAQPVAVEYHYPLWGGPRDDERDARHLGRSTRAAVNLQADIALIVQTKADNPAFRLYGQSWAIWCRARGWHPRWASAVATAYGRWLAESAGVDQDAARQAALAEWQEQLAHLRSLDPEKVGGLPGAMNECLRQIQTLIGVREAAAVTVNLHADVSVDDLGKLSDDELRARYARAIEAEAREDERAETTGGLGGGCAEGNPAARSPVGSPLHPHPSPSPENGSPIPPGPTEALGLCPGCGIKIRPGKSYVRASDGFNWHPGCLRRQEDR